jgi:hypothetical protein
MILFNLLLHLNIFMTKIQIKKYNKITTNYFLISEKEVILKIYL